MQKLEKFISEREFSKIASQDRRDRYAAIIDGSYRHQKEWTLEALAEKLDNIGLLRRRSSMANQFHLPFKTLPSLQKIWHRSN